MGAVVADWRDGTNAVGSGTGWDPAVARDLGESREVGRLGLASHPLVIGVDEGEVTIGSPFAAWHLDEDDRKDFAQLYVAACRKAGRQRHTMTSGEDGRVGGGCPPVPAVETAVSGGDQLAAGTPGDVPAASPVPGMSAEEFERQLRRLIRLNPRLLEEFVRRVERVRRTPRMRG